MAYKSLYGLPLSTPPNFLASFQTTLLSCSTPVPASLLNTESASWCKVRARTIPFTRNPLPPGIYLVGTFPQSQQVSAVTLSGSLFDPLGPKRLPILVLLPPPPSTLLHCSPRHLPVSKMQSLLVYHLMGSCNPPVLSRATLPAPCSLAPGAPFLLILTKHSCKAGFQASGSPRMSF